MFTVVAEINKKAQITNKINEPVCKRHESSKVRKGIKK